MKKEYGERLTWEQISNRINCPTPDDCQKLRGVKQNAKMISHNAIIYSVECNFCGVDASIMTERGDRPE